MRMNTPIIVTVTGQTTLEVREKLVKLAREFGYDDKQETLPLTSSSKVSSEATAQQLPINSAAPEAKEESAVQGQKVETRGRKPGSKNKPSAPDSTSMTDFEIAPEAAEPAKSDPVEPAKSEPTAKIYTLDHIVKKTQELQSQASLKACIATLGKFGASGTKSLKSQDYTSYIEECDKLIAEAKAAK